MTERQSEIAAALRTGCTEALKGLPKDKAREKIVGVKASDVLEVLDALDQSQAKLFAAVAPDTPAPPA